MRSIFIVVAISIGVRTARAQIPDRARDSCIVDSQQAARADSLIVDAGEAAEGSGRPPKALQRYVFSRLRMAVQLAPLDDHHWAMIRQLSLFLDRPDSAVGLAHFALARWPACTNARAALAKAESTAARAHGHERRPN